QVRVFQAVPAMPLVHRDSERDAEIEVRDDLGHGAGQDTTSRRLSAGFPAAGAAAPRFRAQAGCGDTADACAHVAERATPRAMQRVLALETSSRRGSAALYAGEIVAEASHEIPNAHGEQLGKLVDGWLAEAGWSKSQIDRLAVGIGPGSFTGLRVGIALAQGMALGLDRPLVGISSLVALSCAPLVAPTQNPRA